VGAQPEDADVFQKKGRSRGGLLGKRLGIGRKKNGSLGERRMVGRRF